MNRARRITHVANSAKVFSPASAHFWRQLLPHEYVFGCFLILTWARLVIGVGPLNSSALVFAGYVLISLGVIWWALRRPTTFRYRARLLFFPALMGISFYTLPQAVAMLNVPRADPLLAGWDQTLFHSRDWSGFWPGYPFITDLMMLAYLFFFYYLIIGPAYYFFRDLARFRQCFVGLFTVYGLGFIGYTLFPAIGPHGFLAFDKLLAAGWLTATVGPAIDSGSNGIDVFPSIHVAVSLYLLAFDGWHYRRRFWRLLVPCALLWISTVYLRYHYIVDVFAGTAIAAIGLGVAARYQRSVRRAIPVPWELQPGTQLPFPRPAAIWNAFRFNQKKSAAVRHPEPQITLPIRPPVPEID
jgi:membrane-associated phospholipid phosphatase